MVDTCGRFFHVVFDHTLNKCAIYWLIDSSERRMNFTVCFAGFKQQWSMYAYTTARCRRWRWQRCGILLVIVFARRSAAVGARPWATAGAATRALRLTASAGRQRTPSTTSRVTSTDHVRSAVQQTFSALTVHQRILSTVQLTRLWLCYVTVTCAEKPSLPDRHVHTNFSGFKCLEENLWTRGNRICYVSPGSLSFGVPNIKTQLNGI